MKYLNIIYIFIISLLLTNTSTFYYQTPINIEKNIEIEYSFYSFTHNDSIKILGMLCNGNSFSIKIVQIYLKIIKMDYFMLLSPN